VRRGRKSRKREEGSSNSRLKCPSGARETGIDNRENALYNPSVHHCLRRALRAVFRLFPPKLASFLPRPVAAFEALY
jgi:hypothetical protein